MAMRDYFPMTNIEVPEAQEKIIDIMCEAWEECHGSECKECTDRKNYFITMKECLALKESRMLVDAGYVKVVRCKDCKRCELCYPEKAIGKESTPGYFCKHYKEYKRATDFCSFGERKES